MISGMYNKRVQRIEKYIFKALPYQIYIWYSLLYIALPDIALPYIALLYIALLNIALPDITVDQTINKYQAP